MKGSSSIDRYFARVREAQSAQGRPPRPAQQPKKPRPAP
jgi:hypothetical protein